MWCAKQTCKFVHFSSLSLPSTACKIYIRNNWRQVTQSLYASLSYLTVLGSGFISFQKSDVVA